MPTSPVSHSDSEQLLTHADIRRAGAEGIISVGDAERLIEWASVHRFNCPSAPEPSTSAPEQSKGFNAVTVAYYFGALLMISACAWFLGSKWEALGNAGILATVVVYMLIAIGVGRFLRARGYPVGGGLLITVAVSLTPLLVYTIEAMLGLWPGDHPGAYENYYPLIKGSWIVMELATMAAALLALRFVHFGFLTAPLAFSFWFFSMDVAEWFVGRDSWNTQGRAWTSIVVGLITLAVGYGLEQMRRRSGEAQTEDYAFWCYLFGTLAFWGGLTMIDSDSELGRAVYALINIGLIVLAVKTRRAVFLVFGVLGVHVYLGHLAYEVFKDSFLFPFALALLGLSLILVTVFAQRKMGQLAQKEAQQPVS
ncbi:MAG TPA: hypothetical protein VGW12_01635 [Pyrinomonadaceae bacterium]|nr:hypothetical protein [Pyrinomonadaceae bacterium]